MTINRNSPVAGHGNEGNEIPESICVLDSILELLEEADQILIDDAQHLLDNLIL